MKLAQLQEIYERPFFELIDQSRRVYLEHWKGDEIQLCTLLSIKTGGCSEDCSYCAQSARYSTGVQRERLMETEDILARARAARENGSSRFCMGAAWRGVRDGDPRFEQVLGAIREVSKLGMEVCVTLGSLSLVEAQKLKAAGVTAYNHNIDTSPGILPGDREHPHLSGPPEYHRGRPACGNVALLRRHHRHGRDRSSTA